MMSDHRASRASSPARCRSAERAARRLLTPARWIPLACAAATCVPPAAATKGGPPSYPKVVAHVRNIEHFSAGQKDTLAWFDLVNVAHTSPSEIAAMRGRNPHQRILFRQMPQQIIDWGDDDQTWWFPDTAWSLHRLCQFYALKNDWYLYDIHGDRIRRWNSWAANWTPYCPRGAYGTARGKTYSEWYVDVALPQIAYHSVGADAWPEPWGWGSTAFDGIAWEVFADCPASGDPLHYAEADPDRDGIAEGVGRNCWDGGWEDSLSILMHAANEVVRQRLREVHPDLVIVGARGGRHMNPSWLWEELNGLKLEEWEPYRDTPETPRPWHSWWSWMYGRRFGEQGAQGELIGDGYHFAEEVMHPFGIDALEGWDLTYIEVYAGRFWNPEPAEEQRVFRLGLGTSLLGDGYFTLTHDEWLPEWYPAYDWDFGSALGDFAKELVAGDTLYVRHFSHGFVEVNPYFHPLAEIPPCDARFSFWLQPRDLSVTTVGPDRVTLTWEIPFAATNTVERTDLRFHTAPITVANWETCRRPAGSDPPVTPPGTVNYTVGGLVPGTTYYFAARNQVRGRICPLLTAAASATTEPPDTIAPSPVGDLLSVTDYHDGFDLEWTAPGDDGTAGTAAAYLLGYLATRAIVDTNDWLTAVKLEAGLPAPIASGGRQAYRLSGLEPSSLYGLVLRAEDEAGNLSPLPAAPLLAQTLDPQDPPPGAPDPPPATPAAPALSLSGPDEPGKEPGWVYLSWTPVPDVDLLGYNIYGRYAGGSTAGRLNTEPVSATTWVFQAPAATAAYYVAIAAVDSAGNESLRSAEVSIFSLRPDLRGPYPHPIADQGRFVLALPAEGSGALPVRARIYSITGELVRHWVDEAFPAGRKVSLTWDTRNDQGAPVAPGLYFLRLEVGELQEVRKIYVRRR